MYVLLTTKPGEFKTEVTEGLRPVESYDYFFYGRKRASFTIAELADPIRIRIVEDEPPQIVNNVPSKLFEKFETIEDARHQLQTLTTYGSMDTRLQKL
ncbi:MAG: ferredoxin [Bauldia sp.]|nr:MAG: ferredoxin [Bauldia sp.]MBZ0228040.1 ferredoxin [Bauldia sp.]